MTNRSIDAFRRAAAHQLRWNQTDAEVRLWRRLRHWPMQGTHFRRQVPIGPYVADFACMAAQLIVEVDGSQHGVGENVARDEARTRWLEAAGYRVIRFWNNDLISNMDGVLEAIYAAVHGALQCGACAFQACASATSQFKGRSPHPGAPRGAPTLPFQGRVEPAASPSPINLNLAERALPMQWQFWIIQTLNSVAFGGLLFLLSSGFSLIFGLMRIPEPGAWGVLHARRLFRLSLLQLGLHFWLAAIIGGLGVGLLGILMERFILRRLPATSRGRCWSRSASRSSSQACACWSGPATRRRCRRRRRCAAAAGRRLRVPDVSARRAGIALVAAFALYLLMERTRLGAMIRAGVDDMEMARGVGIPVSRLFTTVFLLGATLAGIAACLADRSSTPIPGLDADMLPLALIVVILGGAGSLIGAFVGSFIVGFMYNFGIALVPDLAYFVLFLPMVLVLVFLPQGLFGRVQI